MKLSALAFTSLTLVTTVLTACSAGGAAPVGPEELDGGSGTPRADSGTVPVKPGADASAPDVPPESEPVPTSPFFDVTINGKAMKVKSVTVDRTNLYPSDGTSYYDITATLDQSPPLASGLDSDPTVVIRVGKDENGVDACKEKRGPKVGFIEPVIELREVAVHYRRFTGSSTVTAFPSTKDGSCSMHLKSAATAGQAWGEATGSVQAGTDEPVLGFTVKWFQNVSWK